MAGDGRVFGLQELRERDPIETHTLKHTSLDKLVNRIQPHDSFIGMIVQEQGCKFKREREKLQSPEETDVN